MITHQDDLFVLNTGRTTYAFRVMEGCRWLEHLYYGRKITIHCAEGLKEQHAFAPGNTICYEKGQEQYSLEDVCLECSTLGKGDIREPMAELCNTDGSCSLDFGYEDFRIVEGVTSPVTLPGSYDDTHQASQLFIDMADRENRLKLTLIYTVFPDCDVITRRAVLENCGEGEVRLLRLLSSCVDFDRAGMKVTTFTGAWAREMKKTDTVLHAGKLINASLTGTSSNRANPFVMLADKNADEDTGNCYGFNLIYSGNHYEAFEVNSYGKTRFVQGINPQNFAFSLAPGETFEAPEAVMSFADRGYNSLSRNFHAFVRKHIVRGEYRDKPRPVALNSWEAAYFKINRPKLLKLAKNARDVGIELFVVDDGWFGERNDDSHSLGDWTVNEKKLPGGLSALAGEINDLGMAFGIWVEPEMVNVQSSLYRQHPEWAMDIPGKNHSEGRNQRILDLTREDVQNFVIEAMSKVFGSANISYVKWDMNRIFSDCYSKALPPERQMETTHRYVMGLYRCMRVLTERFPHILFEGCASGGNRFDLGILCYFPQIWASDNTDALCRAEIQNGYSYGYPQSVLSAHVSGVPNHQTLRRTPLETRYDVASFGVLGFECNLCDLSAEDLKKIAGQIANYKKNRQLLQYGDFYRGSSFGGSGSTLTPGAGDLTQWTIASPDGSKAVGVLVQKLVHPNTQYHCFRAFGLKEEGLYHVRTRPQKIDIKDYGDLINTVSPVHIKTDSIVHQIAATLVKLDGAMTDCRMYGDALMYAGLKLKQAFSGTGLNEQVRHFPDFASVRIEMDEIL